MNQLESQVNDLRSFLAVSNLTVPDSGSGASPGPGPGSVPGSATGPIPPSNHISPRSTIGDDAARRRSTTMTIPYEQRHAVPAQQSPAPTHDGREMSVATPDGRGKRKADDEAGGTSRQQRSKRNRYISNACTECKRRKIKCNGETPCQRCGNLNLQCLYAPNCCANGSFRDSDEFKQMTEQVTRLQEQVETLFNSMSSLRQETLRLAPIQDRPPAPVSIAAATPSPSLSSAHSHSTSRPPFRAPPSFRGPTSTTFTVDVAKNTLHKMGYSGPADGVEDPPPRDESPAMSPIFPPNGTSQPAVPRDPLWEFDKAEMIRLCKVHEEEVGIMYPVIKMESIIRHAEMLGSWMESWAGLAKRHGRHPTFGEGEGDGIADMNSLLLKIVLCCGLAVEEHGNSAKAARLYESIQPIVDKKLMSEAPDVANLPLLALVAGYRFLANEEILAWRVIGQVARLCMELGLHRRDGLDRIADFQDRKNALNTFWSAYVLDRRWSFGTGLPYVCHDDKIDPKLPHPDDHPYLVAMITYSRLGAKVWRLVDYFEPAFIRELQRSDIEQLDDEILRWYDSVPEEVKISSLDPEMIPVPKGPNYDLQRLQIWTRMRLNQIRIWLYTPVLHSASSIAANIPLADRVVGFAKDTIHYLARLNHTTSLYRRIQVFYHQFLTSAIAVLFLASTHAPLQYSAVCRSEFYMALELIKDLSTKSWVSQRLWRTIRSLRSYAARLGMEDHDARPRSPTHPRSRTSSAAPSPAHVPHAARTSYSVAGRHVVDPVLAASPTTAPPAMLQHMAEDHNNGRWLQTEMSRMYEGYMGMHSSGLALGLAHAGYESAAGPMRASVAEMVESEAGRGDESVYEHFRDMF